MALPSFSFAFAVTLLLVGIAEAEAEAIGFGIGDETEVLKLSSSQREFDYFALALQWAPTYCRRTRHCCSSNACCRGENAPTEFTIHGLWPDYNDGTWPSCCTQESFDANEISSLEDVLNKYWPSLSCGSSKTCHGTKGPFWAHEWEKHGTCSYPVTKDEYNYFLTTIMIYEKYNVTSVLAKEGYVPSNTEKYPLGGVVSAIQNAFHTTPQVICSNGAIEELRICFCKDFTPRDCVSASTTRYGKVSSGNSCPDYVSLPEYMPLDIASDGTVNPWNPEEAAS